MILQKNTANRLGIFVFYDKDGIADEYNFYFIEELKKQVSRLLVICNGDVEEEAGKRFSRIADEVMMRGNEGFDITAYHLGLKKYGYNRDGKFDEVIICNSTMFGPVYPFREMFEKMAVRDLDFWGITNFHEVPFDPFGTVKYGMLPKHVQSFFMVFRKSLTMSPEFQKYWEDMPQITSYEQAIGYHEAIFTKESVGGLCRFRGTRRLYLRSAARFPKTDDRRKALSGDQEKILLP